MNWMKWWSRESNSSRNENVEKNIVQEDWWSNAMNELSIHVMWVVYFLRRIISIGRVYYCTIKSSILCSITILYEYKIIECSLTSTEMVSSDIKRYCRCGPPRPDFHLWNNQSDSPLAEREKKRRHAIPCWSECGTMCNVCVCNRCQIQ